MNSKEGAFALMVAAVLFGVWGVFTLLGEPAQLLGGDAYNYMTAAGRGTGLACVGIICAVLANTLSPKD